MDVFCPFCQNKLTFKLPRTTGGWKELLFGQSLPIEVVFYVNHLHQIILKWLLFFNGLENHHNSNYNKTEIPQNCCEIQVHWFSSLTIGEISRLAVVEQQSSSKLSG